MSEPTGRMAGLDVLRGIAIALVMLRHALPTVFPGAGVVGVVMFFALSGYLITGVLLGEIERTGTVDLRLFYFRRARRLVPALVALVAGVMIVTLVMDPLDDRDQLVKTVLVALTWTGNLPFGHASDATFHLWTLATEEQFYLFWPAVLVLAAARQRVGAALVLAATACTLACAATVLWLQEAPDLAYSLPTSWALCFVIGASTRVLQNRLRVLPLLVVPALAALGVLSVIPLRGHALTYLAGGPAIAALTSVLLVSWCTWKEASTPWLRALAWLGTVSYGAYLWNYPLTLWLRPSWGEFAGPSAMVLTVVAAAASWHLVERPVQHRRTAEPVRP